MRFLDPGYQYLYNGVVVVQGGVPTHTDHPGTSLQWLSGIVSWLVHLFRIDSSSLRMDLAANSTLYLKVNAIVLLLAFLLSFVLLGLRTLRHLGVIATLALVSGVGASLRIWYPQVFLLTPESVVLTAATVVVALLVPCFGHTAHQLRTSELALIGLALAVGTTSKVIIVPLFLLVPFLLKPRQILIVATSFLVSAAIILIPVYSQFGRMRGWFLGIATKPTRYGSSSTDWQVLENLKTALQALGDGFALYVISFACSVLLALWIWLPRDSRGREIRRSSRQTIGLFLTIVLTYATSYKPSVQRDFVLLVVLVPQFVAHVAQTSLNPTNDLQRSSRPIWPKISTAIAIVLGVIQFPLSLYVATHEIARWRVSYAQIAGELKDTESAAWVAYAYGSPSISHASFFGNAWANEHFDLELVEVFPRKMELDVWTKSIYGWNSDFHEAELSCDELNSRLEDSDMYVAVYQSQLNVYWPNHDDGLAMKSGTLKVLEEKTTGFEDLLLLRIGECS